MDDRKRLWASALKLLSSRPRSITEVKTRLTQKSSDVELVNQILDSLIKDKLLDDAKFSEWYIASRSRSRPRSAKMLSFELKQKGITDSSIQIDEFQLAQDALAKKLRLWQHLPKLEATQKASRFLASRGFSWDIISKVIKLL